MKRIVNIRHLKFYLWVGLTYFILWVIHDLANTPDHSVARVFNILWRLIYVIAINYIFLEYAIPFAWRKRRFIFFNILLSLLFLLAQMLLCSFGLFAWRQLGIGIHVYTSLRVFESTEEAVSHGTGFGLFSILFFGILKHLYNYYQLRATTQQLRIEKQAAELNYLKSQTNPHFLFNTLNNIYSLSRDKSDLAPESILRLSKILRFMLYETGGEYIAIEQELKIMDDYIALEKLRYDESLRVNFNHDIENMKQALPPLLMIPLVENAFKHGVSETRLHPFIDIHLSVQKRQLSLMVRNSTEFSPEVKGVKENIGLTNLRRQLELLYTDYKLSVQQSDSVFTASLIINLSSHVKNQMHNRRG